MLKEHREHKGLQELLRCVIPVMGMTELIVAQLVMVWVHLCLFGLKLYPKAGEMVQYFT